MATTQRTAAVTAAVRTRRTGEAGALFTEVYPYRIGYRNVKT